jgi:isopenicillin N synthase-like dioxygenase
MISFIDPPRLPTIDLSLFDIGDPWRDHVAAQVDWAASTFGVFQILGHGVDSALIDTLVELGAKYIHRGSDPWNELPGFHDTVREYTTTMTGLGHRLMTTMARGLHLDDSFFVDRYSGNPVTSLRIRERLVSLEGSSLADSDDGGADRGLLTIVRLGEAEGQQVQFDDQWLDVPALPGSLLCYVGPVLERLTHGHYVSAAHRLSLGSTRDRPSISFAFEPALEAVLTPVTGVSPQSDTVGVGASPQSPWASRYGFAARC